MPMLDLGLVTQALRTLLIEYFEMTDAWPPAQSPNVTPLPPDKVTGSALSLYLFHAMEDSHFKNTGPGGNPVKHIQYNPMALNLFYIMTALSDDDSIEGTGILQDQQKMGIAMKAFHDHPVLNKDSEIEGTPIFPLELQDEKDILRISLQQMPPDTGLNYWSASEVPPRFSVQYLVSVVLLEPEQPEVMPQRVLSYGIQSFVSGLPHIETSRYVLTYLPPESSEPGRVELRPAQVPAGSRVSFLGSGFANSVQKVMLKNTRWDSPVELDSSWDIQSGTSEFSIEVQATADTEDVLPGVYSAIAVVRRRIRDSRGNLQDFEHKSNESPFLIVPRIDSITGPTGSDPVVTVQGYIFQHADLDAESLEVYIGSQMLQEVGGAVSAGEFTVNSSTEIQLEAPSGLISGQHYSLRIIVNGAESQPAWIQIP